MKKVFLMTLLAALLLFSACGKEKRMPVSQPPQVVITLPEGEVTRSSLAFHWRWIDENGQEMGGARHAERIERWWDRDPHLTTASGTAQLAFALPPDAVEVTRYDPTTDGKQFMKLEDVTVMPLDEGRITYEIKGKWTDKSRDWYGEAVYSICIEKK